MVIDLDVPGADVTVLDPEEAVPIARLRRPLDRARFGAAHAGARVILGAYLRYPPTDALDEPARSAAFLRLWARKEAVLKACGMGIADGLEGWSARDLPLSGHVAALATAGAREPRWLRVPPEVAR